MPGLESHTFWGHLKFYWFVWRDGRFNASWRPTVPSYTALGQFLGENGQGEFVHDFKGALHGARVILRIWRHHARDDRTRKHHLPTEEP